MSGIQNSRCRRCFKCAKHIHKDRVTRKQMAYAPYLTPRATPPAPPSNDVWAGNINVPDFSSGFAQRFAQMGRAENHARDAMGYWNNQSSRLSEPAPPGDPLLSDRSLMNQMSPILADMIRASRAINRDLTPGDVQYLAREFNDRFAPFYVMRVQGNRLTLRNIEFPSNLEWSVTFRATRLPLFERIISEPGPSGEMAIYRDRPSDGGLVEQLSRDRSDRNFQQRYDIRFMRDRPEPPPVGSTDSINGHIVVGHPFDTSRMVIESNTSPIPDPGEDYEDL